MYMDVGQPFPTAGCLWLLLQYQDQLMSSERPTTWPGESPEQGREGGREEGREGGREGGRGEREDDSSHMRAQLQSTANRPGPQYQQQQWACMSS